MIFAQSRPATAALQKATQTIPIVFTFVIDPIGAGFVANVPLAATSPALWFADYRALDICAVVFYVAWDHLDTERRCRSFSRVLQIVIIDRRFRISQKCRMFGLWRRSTTAAYSLLRVV